MVVHGGVGLGGFLHGLEQVGQGVGGVVQLVEHPAHAIQERRVVRVQLHGFFDELFGLFQFDAAFRPHVPHVIHGFRVVGLEFEAFFEIFLGLLVMLGAFVGGPELEVEDVREPVGGGGRGDDFGVIVVLQGLGVILGADIS